MHIDCPHCQNPIEIVESAAFKEVVCPSCGSSFSTSDLQTKTYHGPTPPFAKIGRFELKELLGQGAFGSVWRASDTELDRDVAVKVPRPGVMGGAEFEDRFLRELRAMAGLRHEGIVTVHEGGRQDGSLYIVSDLIRGVNLAEWLTGQPGGRLGMREAATLLAQIADAVEHAHAHGVIHRDLKPSNILLDESGRPHISDFGLAKREAVEAPITREGRHLGTPAYMSPEQAAGQSHRADAKSDVWSLGVILYELLTGERPFRGVERMILHQILKDEPRSLRRINDRIPLDLDTITLKCLAKEPDRRYASASALADDLRRWLGGEPIHARPISGPERLYRWAKRNPRVAVLIAAVFILLTTVAIVSSVAVVIVNEHRRIAEKARDNERLQREAAEASEQMAKEAEQTAEERRRQADAVAGFLVKALRRPDPSLDGGKLTVAGLLGQAVIELEKDFPNDPLTRARLLHAIGQTFDGLGLGKKAQETYEAAYDLRKQHLGEENEDTLATASNLGHVYSSLGHLDEALRLQRQCLDQYRQKFGPNHIATITAANNLAGTCMELGQYDEAISLFEMCREELEKQAGADVFFKLVTLNNLAQAFQANGQLEKALPILKQCVDEMRSKLGPADPNTLVCSNNLALNYATTGKFDQAIPVYQECLKLMRMKLPEAHPNILQAMHGLGISLRGARRYEQAEFVLRECWEIRKRSHPDDWFNFEEQWTLGVTLREQLRFDEAESMLIEGYQGLQARIETIPPGDRDRVETALRQIVKLYEDWQKPEEAEKWRAKLNEKKGRGD